MYAKRKRVLKGRIVDLIRPETGRSNHEQVEKVVVYLGGPNHIMLQYVWMTCG